MTSNPRAYVAERSTPAGNASEQVQRAQGPGTHATRAPRLNPTNDTCKSNILVFVLKINVLQFSVKKQVFYALFELFLLFGMTLDLTSSVLRVVVPAGAFEKP